MKKIDPEVFATMQEAVEVCEGNIELFVEQCLNSADIDVNNKEQVAATCCWVDFAVQMIRLGFETISRWEAVRHYFDESIQARFDKAFDEISTDDETEEKE